MKNYSSCIANLAYHKVASSRSVYYSIFEHFRGATNWDVRLKYISATKHRISNVDKPLSTHFSSSLKVVIMLKAMAFLNFSTKNSNHGSKNYLAMIRSRSVKNKPYRQSLHNWVDLFCNLQNWGWQTPFYQKNWEMSFIGNWKQKFIDGSASYHCKVIFAPTIWIFGW